jgi:phage pi2 protein 07
MLFFSSIVLAQPGVRFVEFSFRFFDKQGNIVTPHAENSEIKINFIPQSHLPKWWKISDSVEIFNGYFSGTFISGEMIDILFILEKDTMKIKTSESMDSIPFLKGNFLISPEIAPLLSIKPHNGANIDKQKQIWEIFRNDNSKEKLYIDSLKITDCKYWKNYKAKIPMNFKPTIQNLLFNTDFSSNLYAWNSQNVYVSEDKGKNWENIFSLSGILLAYKIMAVSYQKDGLLLFLRESGRPLQSAVYPPLVYFSKNGGRDFIPVYTDMRFWFAGFKEKQGFAFEIQYLNKKEIRTIVYSSKNGGKNWEKTSCFDDAISSTQILYWNNDTVIVKGWEHNYYSFNGGSNWNIMPKSFYAREHSRIKYWKNPFKPLDYYKYLGNVYPVFGNDRHGFTHYLDKMDDEKEMITELLTIKSDYYVEITATKNVWCISASLYTLISKDNGKNWKYYSERTYGVSLFRIIDDKYIFDGEKLYEFK